MIIGINGKKQSGKDLTAKIIQWLTFSNVSGGEVDVASFQEWVTYSTKFPLSADHLSRYEIIKAADKLKDMVCLLTGCTRKDLEDEEFKSKELPSLWNDGYKPWTYRSALQFIGTDLFRNQFHPDTWINVALRSLTSDSNVIVTDVRFLNELLCVKNSGGLMIRIDRPSLPVEENPHESEIALDASKEFDYIITNNDNLNDLISTVEQILIREKLI